MRMIIEARIEDSTAYGRSVKNWTTRPQVRFAVSAPIRCP